MFTPLTSDMMMQCRLQSMGTGVGKPALCRACICNVERVDCLSGHGAEGEDGRSGATYRHEGELLECGQAREVEPRRALAVCEIVSFLEQRAKRGWRTRCERGT